MSVTAAARGRVTSPCGDSSQARTEWQDLEAGQRLHSPVRNRALH